MPIIAALAFRARWSASGTFRTWIILSMLLAYLHVMHMSMFTGSENCGSPYNSCERLIGGWVMGSFRRTSWTGIFTAACSATIAAGAFLFSVEAVPQIASVPAPTLTVTTREVLLDVVAIGLDGQPVNGLKASDFRVTEEGTPQAIRNLEEHRPAPATDLARMEAAPVLPPNTFSNYTPTVSRTACTVLLLDAMDTPLAAQAYLRQQLIAYLKHMAPGPSIAIFQLDTQIHLVQGFTSDPAVLLAAAESRRDMPSLAKPVRGTPDYTYRTRIGGLRGAMRMIGRYVAAFPGRKNLIWFTGQVPMTMLGTSGFGSPFPDSYHLLIDDLQDATGVLAMSRVAVYPVDARGLQADPTYDASRAKPPSPEAGMRWAARLSQDHMNLDEVAEATGGKAFYNTNGLKQVIGEAIANGSNYYTIAYATTNTKWNGEFRRIRITLDRPGVHLQYRNGYWARNRDQQQANELAAAESRVVETDTGNRQTNPRTADAAEPTNVDGALVRARGGFVESMGLGAIPPTEIVFAASLRPSDTVVKLRKNEPLPKGNFLRAEWQHKPFRDYTVLIRADANHIEATRSPDGVRHIKVQFAAVVYNAEGQPVNSFGETDAWAFGSNAYRELLVSGLALKEKIAIPTKGNYFLRLGVHDLTGDRIGAFEIPVDQIKLGVAGEDLKAQ